MMLALRPPAARPWRMRRAVLAISLLAAVPALAQTANGPAAEKRATADRLLGALKAAPNEEVAAPLEHQIRELWLTEGTPSVTLLMSRGLREMTADATNDAIEDFSDATTLDPDLAEAYHERAVARFTAGDSQGAISDIQAAVQREPRSFPAFQTLSTIAEAQKNWKGAYEAWQKVMELDPKTPGGDERLKDLKRHALGEET
jgi:tetratricopeptide (TPR) repeat protein